MVTVAAAWKATVSDRTKAFCKGPAHPVYYITLNLNISASRRNIKNMIGNFGAIHVVIMHTKYQAS